MVIAFEEKYRTVIESNGITIIEFKRNLYKVIDWVKKLWEAAKKATQQMIEAFADPIKEIAEKLKKLLEDIADWYESLPESEKHKIVRYYAKANNPSTVINKQSVYHCRNNC